MTEVEETAPVRGMDADEQDLADSIYQAVMRYSLDSPRSQQAAQFKIGVSDLGYCSERTRRMLDQQKPDDTDVLAAFIGSAIGDWAEQAIAARWPQAVLKAEVVCPLHGDGGDYLVNGHPDVLLPGLVVDVKTTRGLGVVRRTGPDRQQQFQRHCYAKAAWLGGYFPGIPLEEVKVANVWFDRAGDEKEAYVQMEPYDERWVEEATMWLDDVIYAFVHQQTARKEPPREVCAATCGFFGDCRAQDTDVTGLLTDDTILAAVEMHREGAALRKQANLLLDQAKANLSGVIGSTGKFSVRWVNVNGSHVEYDRAGYQRLDIKEVK